MLRAAAGRVPKRNHLRRHPLPQPPESLFLSFLYPALGSSASTLQWPRYSSTASTPPAPRPEKPSRSSSAQSERSYATATTTFSSTDPILNADLRLLGYQPPRMVPAAGDLSQVMIFDDPLPQTVATNPETGARLHRYSSNSVSNVTNEVLATFNACITVGRIARAQLMLQQISVSLDKDSPLLVGAHNTFLQALLNRALAVGEDKEANLRTFFMWYENRMKLDLNVAGDATTIALLLKGSLSMPNGVHGTLYVKQYVQFWKEQGRDIGEVLDLPVLTDEEVVNVAKICALKVNELHEKQRILFREDEPSSPPAIASIPDVAPTQVKGPGLAAVKRSLRSLIDPDAIPTPHIFGKDDLAFQIERQKLLEEDAFDSAIERWKKDHESQVARGVFSMSTGLNHLLWRWHQSMVPFIKEELVKVAEAEDLAQKRKSLGHSDRCLYGPFLRVMTPEKIAAVVVLEMIRLQQNMGTADGAKSSVAVMTVGKGLEAEYMAQELSKKKYRDFMGGLGKEDLKQMFDNKAEFRRQVKHARAKLAENAPTMDLLPEWPTAIQAKLGAILISMLLYCAKITVTKTDKAGKAVTESHPAFYHSYEYIKGRKLGMLKLHTDVIKQLGNEPLRRGVVGRQLPMVVPPRPWMAWDDGGYYYARSRVVRTRDSKEQEIYVRAASARGDLDQLFEGLDVLGRTAWKINQKVFDIVLNVWNKGEKFADIPPNAVDIDVPPEPAPGVPHIERAKWLKKAREAKNEEKNNHSMRADINFKVEIARAFLFERFYFPHNVDFRGRAYPIPPNLNHVGNDLSRGLLMFDDAKELGESGLRWLKIHLSNLAGYDKASFADRVKFADDHFEDIFDSADRPLEGKRWWLESEDPWQCLAACFALREAYSLPDPTKYLCNLPVAMDGTCNGLQHYAALGGDMMGARQVNLQPSDKPQDVYTGVAELVRAEVDKDLKDDHPMAKLLEGLISRKVVKQTVMTNVYGVTFIGAKAQIEGQLKDIPKIPREQVGTAALYLTKQVFKSIRSMFKGASDIQNWFALAARRISRSVGPVQFKKLRECAKGEQPKIEFMTSVVWTTPLNMPVVQPYRQNKLQVVQTNLQKVYIHDPTLIDEVNSRKQMTAFPPNFIHSLDATHMLLSAMKCAEHGLTFASVHDSFWTHPGDIDTLNRILRDAFVSLHSANLMDRLLAEFETRYAGYKTLTNIDDGTPIARQIKQARREYAQEVLKKGQLTVVEDLEWELERDRLRASEDPEERAKGDAMETPSVILSRAGGVENLESAEKVEGMLGDESKTPRAIGAGVEADAVLGDGAEATIEEAEADTEAGMEADTEAGMEADTEAGMEAGFPLEPELAVAAEDAVAVQDPEAVREQAQADMAVEEGATLGSEWAEPLSKSPIANIKKKRSKQKLTYPKGRLQVWMPLKFPPVPEKGEFDITMLKDSKYFFS